MLLALTALSVDGNVNRASKRFHRFSEAILAEQTKIIGELENFDIEGKFLREPFERNDELGNLMAFGVTCVVQNGKLIEKGGVSTTVVSGKLSDERAEAMTGRGRKGVVAGAEYYACALSLCLHSASPRVPTFRGDVRYFELENGDAWFGGGADLTPYDMNEELFSSFHTFYKSICDEYGSSHLYKHCKTSCDDYFFIPCRQEYRGIGGIFFDDLSPGSFEGAPVDMASVEAFTLDVCKGFMPSYLPLVAPLWKVPYTERQRHFQLVRRGRYIEFNLLYDRGVRFGLVPGGRVESVFVSCPPLVAWDYKYDPNEEEERLQTVLRAPRQWA